MRNMLLVASFALAGCTSGTPDADSGVADAALDAGPQDAGLDSALDSALPDEGVDATVPDAGPALVTFELTAVLSDFTTPAAGVTVCPLGAPTSRCVSSSAAGAVSIALEPSTDHVLELTLAGHRSVLYPVHMDTASAVRSGPFAFFTPDEDAAYYVTPIDATTATLTLRAEGSPMLAHSGEAGVVFEVVAPTGIALAYANDAATMLDATRTEASTAGLAGATQVPVGTVDVRGHDMAGAPCRPWYGGFEMTSGSMPVSRVPVLADHDTRLEMRCAP